MGRYILKRLVLLIPVVFGVVTITFFLIHITPGDPASSYLGNRATPEAVAALRHQWGLDKPLFDQYLSFIGGLFTGNFGQSLHFHTPISTLLGQRIPLTLLLMLFSAVLAAVISVPLAMIAATHENGVADWIVRIVNALAQGMPQFWVGTMLIIYLAVNAGIFPVGGYGTTVGEHFVSLVLPSLTVSLTLIPTMVKSLRSSLIDALNSEYVNFAKSKGLSERRMLIRYVLKNGSVSGISVFGINVGALAGGSLIVENVFALPGMGATMMQGVLTRDFPVVQVCTLVFAIIVVLVYLLTDIAYSLVDPRVRLS